jgi:hypothetical protein
MKLILAIIGAVFLIGATPAEVEAIGARAAERVAVASRVAIAWFGELH